MNPHIIKLSNAAQLYEAMGCFVLAEFFRNLIYSYNLTGEFENEKSN